MKEFISAIQDDESERNDNKVPLLDANDEPIRDDEGNVIMDDPHARFMVDGRLMRAYLPDAGQLIFMMAEMGRGQTDANRMAGAVNTLLSTLRDEDADYLQSRLLTRDKAQKIAPELLSEIFEHVAQEWFARPTQPSSGSAPSQPNAGEKSTLTTITPEAASSESDPTGS